MNDAPPLNWPAFMVERQKGQVLLLLLRNMKIKTLTLNTIFLIGDQFDTYQAVEKQLAVFTDL
jgi:hypothetical protein